MANVAYDVTWQVEPRGGRDIYLASSGDTHYAGSLAFITTNGRVATGWTDANTVRFVGLVLEKVVGDGSNWVRVDTSGVTLRRVTVAGTSATVSVGRAVYAATAGLVNPNDLTLTTALPNFNKAVGVITRFYSGTTVDVTLFTPAEHASLWL
jgi:hypothetical protein